MSNNQPKQQAFVEDDAVKIFKAVIEEEFKNITEATTKASQETFDGLVEVTSKMMEEIAANQAAFQKKMEDRLNDLPKSNTDESLQKEIDALKKRLDEAEASVKAAANQPKPEPSFADKSLEVAKALSTPLMVASVGMMAYAGYKLYKS